MKIFDISPLLSSRTAVFPGDKKFSRKVAMDFTCGDHLTLSAVETTLHLGAHVDAPNHYHPDGASADGLALGRYLGPCQVIDVRGRGGPRIAPEDLNAPVTTPRVLLKTGSFPDPDSWHGDFRALSPELVDFLADHNVCLIGIDTPSVDLADSKDLPSHARLFTRNVSNLEGLWLEEVSSGHYSLVALPLRLEGADASPVRAILLPPTAVVDPLCAQGETA